MENAGRLTRHGQCTHCMQMHWSPIYVIFGAQGTCDTLFTLAGKSAASVPSSYVWLLAWPPCLECAQMRPVWLPLSLLSHGNLCWRLRPAATATERDALEVRGDKREETIALGLTLPPSPRSEVGIWMGVCVCGERFCPCSVTFSQ